MKYTEEDLVKFGKYLLSKERKKTIKEKENRRLVNHVDLENFKLKKEEPIYEYQWLYRGIRGNVYLSQCFCKDEEELDKILRCADSAIKPVEETKRLRKQIPNKKLKRSYLLVVS